MYFGSVRFFKHLVVAVDLLLIIGLAFSTIYLAVTAYLTFDDGPTDRTAEILDILKKEEIKATFFIVGKFESITNDVSPITFNYIFDE